MRIAVQLEPAQGTPSDVDYCWDPDTDILSAHLPDHPTGAGMSGSVGLEGSDGSWLILDLQNGRIKAVEVAVWPDVRRLSSLRPPDAVDDASIVVPLRRSQPNVASVEVDTSLAADSDTHERTFHFRLGKPTPSRTVRVAKDLLLDVDAESHLTGLWLLNVPPCPAAST